MNRKELQLREGINQLKKILKRLNIKPVTVIGRVKDKKSTDMKRQNLHIKSIPIKNNVSDAIGIRIILKNQKNMNKIYKTLIREQNITFVKDYVNQPRLDGLILKTNPKEKYQSYHVFTDSLNGVQTEIQIRTQQMENSRLKLAEKYGEGYWKTKEFRRRKYLLGDKR